MKPEPDSNESQDPLKPVADPQLLEENPFLQSKPREMGAFKYYFYHLAKSKTCFCRHEGSCASNCFLGGVKSFYLGFVIRLIINLLVLVIFQKKQRKKSFSWTESPIFYLMLLFQKSNFSLGGFLGLYTFLTKSTLCLLRRVRNNDAGINSFISGLIAGFFSMMLQPKSNWFMWRVYLWSRAFDTIYQHLIRKKVIKDHFWNWGLIMGTFNTLIVYGFLQEPECLPKDVVKLYFKFAHLHENDLIWRAGAMEWRRRLLLAQGIGS